MAGNQLQEFSYQPGRSTSAIFYKDDDGNNRSLIWRPTPISVPIFPTVDTENPPGELTICASSRGFTVCRDDARSNYYICNPFAPRNRYRGPLGLATSPWPPRHSDSSDVDVVLAIHHPEHPFESFHVICAICEALSGYTFHAFSSRANRWATHQKIILQDHRDIVLNTGVSCGGFAYWLTEHPRSVLRFDIKAGDVNNMTSFLELPPAPADARMQLGRVGNGMLGLVIVNQADSIPRVELYTRGIYENRWGDPDYFRVEIDQGAANTVVGRVRDGVPLLVFREMPRPMRFESFKMEALLWAAGKVVLLERSAIRQDLYAAVLLDCEASAAIIGGLPHISTDRLATVFLPGTIQFLN